MMVRMSQRRARRGALRLQCRVVRPLKDELVGKVTLDLSPEGMLVLAEDDVLPGERLHVSFRATELDIPFDTDATVTRLVHNRRPGDSGPALGLCFGSLDSVKRLILRGFLRKIPPPLPKREQRVDYAATVGRILFG
jgi:hypothetical protein